jgi:hypothetical protein
VRGELKTIVRTKDRAPNLIVTAIETQLCPGVDQEKRYEFEPKPHTQFKDLNRL